MDKANAAFTARTETWNPTMSDVLRREPRPARLPGEAGTMLGMRPKHVFHNNNKRQDDTSGHYTCTHICLDM